MNRALLALALGADVVSGHGMMTKPASRQIVHHTAIDPKVAGSDGYSTVIHNPAQTDLVSLNAAIGGGGKAKAAAEGHGLCGDDGGRKMFETGVGINPAYTWDTTPVETYAAGSTIDIEVYISAPHRGWFEFRLCEDGNNLSQECLNEHVLEFDYEYTKNLYTAQEMGGWHDDATDYLGDQNNYCNVHTQCDALMEWPEDSEFGGVFDGSCCRGGGTCSPEADNRDRLMFPGNSMRSMPLKFKLPAGVTCEHCVLQWLYVTGNSCDYYPEAFFNCADVKIVASGGSKAPTPAPAPTLKPVAPFPTPSMPGRCCWWDVVRENSGNALISNQCDACTSDMEMEGPCSRSEEDCDACGGEYCAYDASWTPAPSPAVPDGDDCSCGSIVQHIDDSWCVAV